MTDNIYGEELVTVTVRQVYEAIAKNGFTHLRMEWGGQGAGCVLQQGAMNLGVVAESEALKETAAYKAYEGLDWGDAVRKKYQEINSYTIYQQLNKFLVQSGRWRDRYVELAIMGYVEGYVEDYIMEDENQIEVEVGNAIVFFNDLGWIDKVMVGSPAVLNPDYEDVNPSLYYEEHGKYPWEEQDYYSEIRWELPTYQDVVDMARDILTPYFDREIQVLRVNWEIPAAI